MNTAATTDQPVISVDAVALCMHEDTLRVLLICRSDEPFRHRSALPGVMMRTGETARLAARRALSSKAGVRCGDIAWQGTGRYYGEHRRDPRGPTLSLAQTIILVPGTAGWDGDRWVSPDDVGKLPFGHAKIVADSVSDIAARLWSDSEIFPALLGSPFNSAAVASLSLQLGHAPRANIARTLESMFTATGKTQPVGPGAPARLWV